MIRLRSGLLAVLALLVDDLELHNHCLLQDAGLGNLARLLALGVKGLGA